MITNLLNRQDKQNYYVPIKFYMNLVRLVDSCYLLCFVNYIVLFCVKKVTVFLKKLPLLICRFTQFVYMYVLLVSLPSSLIVRMTLIVGWWLALVHYRDFNNIKLGSSDRPRLLMLSFLFDKLHVEFTSKNLVWITCRRATYATCDNPYRCSVCKYWFN